jgi:DNA-directed RNA polymerase specialized sigma24 family protein
MFLPWRLSAGDNPHEQAFVERLDKVLLWARQITSGDTALAEDLAQDAFLHFTTGRPPLHEISNLDKYLYVVLKNLFRSHLASVSRRSAVPFDPLAHENAIETWRSVNPERRLTLRDELRRICLFVCERKETSKGASAFLLHFFHNAPLSDVAVLMQTTRGAVDERLSVTRKEMRRWLDRPAPMLVRSGFSEDDLTMELQSIIAASSRGNCFSAEEARLRYGPEAGEMPKDRLAHLASCVRCLRMVAQLLEFPDHSGSPPAVSSDQNRVSRWRRKRTDLLAAEPAELRLIVNGHLLATERVHHPNNEFTVLVALHEPLDFVEVRNGEVDRLLLLPGISEPPDGKFDQGASVDLLNSKLHLSLRFTEPWPTLAIQYQARTQECVAAARPTIAALSVFRRPTLPRLSIPAFSTVVALVMILILLFVQTRQTTLDAAELLNRAEKWQENITTERAPVLHRRFGLTKRGRGTATQLTFVDVWRSAGMNVRLSRWTDTAGHTLAEVKAAPSALPPLNAKTIWQFEPSADTFAAVVGAIDHAAVSVGKGQATIRTSAAELVLDRATNRPVAERLSFDDDEYVFSEYATETIPLAASPFVGLIVGKPAKAKHLGPSTDSSHVEIPYASLDSKPEERELRARRGLHLLGLGAAATIQRHGDTVDVQLAPTSADQVDQVQAALENIPGVRVSLLDAQAAVRDAAPIENRTDPVPRGGKLKEPLASKWLKVSLQSEAEIQAEEARRVEAAQHLVEQVAEWRLLAERYPIVTEAHLSAEAKSILNEIVNDLRTRIRRDITAELTAVAKLLVAAGSPAGQSDTALLCESWQSQAARAADLLWENDQAVEQFYAPAFAVAPAASGNDDLAKLRDLTYQLDIALRVSCNNR